MAIELIESSYCSFWKCGSLTLDIGCPSPLPLNWKKVSSSLCNMCNDEGSHEMVLDTLDLSVE